MNWNRIELQLVSVNKSVRGGKNGSSRINLVRKRGKTPNVTAFFRWSAFLA